MTLLRWVSVRSIQRHRVYAYGRWFSLFVHNCGLSGVESPHSHRGIQISLGISAGISVLVDNLVGIILYGSVARGEADRRSDIDLWVLTRSGRAVNQREANAVARELEERVFDGDRYAYDIDIESVNSIPDYTAAIREIVVSGIPIYTTDDFETVEEYLLEVSSDNA